jgi:predicted Zn-ribbon and HTH transcriptional regulator
MKKVQEKHGHVWMTNHDSDPDLAKDSEYGKSVNIFATSKGYHNGPRCKNCGYEFGRHCICEFDVPECINRNKGK